MKTPTPSVPFFYQAARILKLAGTISILISLVKMALLLVPPQPGNVRWWLGFTTGMTDLGIVPLLGMALVYAGFGFEQMAGASEKKLQPLLNLKNWIFIIAGFLGIVFLLLIPLHVMQTLSASEQALARVDRQTASQEEQVEIQLQQQRSQIQGLLGDDASLEEYIVSNELTEEQLTQLQEFQTDPSAVERQSEALKTNLITDIRERAVQAKERSKLGVLKSIVRVGTGNVLLAACYLSISWSGLRQGKGKRPKAPRRS